MRSGLSTHAEVKEIVEIIGVLAQRGNVKLNLTIELRNKGAMKGMLEWLSQSSLINHNLKGVSLE